MASIVVNAVIRIGRRRVRAAALIHLRDEVPHAIAIRIDEYTERGDQGAYIAATLFVERNSQKGIIIGKKGQKLKKIGEDARKEIERMLESRIFLKLFVHVEKNWSRDTKAMRRLGYG